MMRANFDLTIGAASVFMIALAIVIILILEIFVGFDRVVGQGMFRGASARPDAKTEATR
jgi:putative spermidine/putrescine transport system permease protein